ncbi:MAG TPA: hypothetical protein PKD00_06085 [Burkholderiales bacterium]|nr:hypothetical protein [Burkholderiales bacterium]
MANKYYISPGVVVRKAKLGGNLANRIPFDPIIEEITEALTLDLSAYLRTTLIANTAVVGNTYNFTHTQTTGTFRVNSTTGNQTLRSVHATTPGDISLRRVVDTVEYTVGVFKDGIDKASMAFTDSASAVKKSQIQVTSASTEITVANDVSAAYSGVLVKNSFSEIAYTYVADGANSSYVRAGSALVTIASARFKVIGLPTYADEAAAVIGGLATDTLYKTAAGELRIKL